MSASKSEGDEADARRMAAGPPAPDAPEAEHRHWRRLVGQKLNELAGNPLDDEEIAMFRRFEAEGTSNEDAIAEILKRGQMRAQGLL